MKFNKLQKSFNQFVNKTKITKFLNNKNFLLYSIIFFIIILALHDIINNLIENITIFSLIFLVTYWFSKDFLISLLLGTIGLIFNMAKIEHFKENFENKITDEDIENIELNVDPADEKENFKSAQENTYALIDTVKQLKETLETFGPTIKEGKKVMKMLKMIKKN